MNRMVTLYNSIMREHLVNLANGTGLTISKVSYSGPYSLLLWFSHLLI